MLNENKVNIIYNKYVQIVAFCNISHLLVYDQLYIMKIYELTEITHYSSSEKAGLLWLISFWLGLFLG